MAKKITPPKNEKKKIAATRLQGASLLKMPQTDPVVRLMTRIILLERRRAAADKKFILPIYKSKAASDFNAAPYLRALSLAGRAGGPSKKLRIKERGTGSAHLLNFRAEPASPKKRKIKRSLLTPRELPELRALAAKDSAEFLLPRFEERINLQKTLPQGAASLGANAVSGALQMIEGASAPVRSVFSLIPGIVGLRDQNDDLLPRLEPAGHPKTIAWASGVPKNLPVEELAADDPRFKTSAAVQVDSSAKEPFLERLERTHDLILNALRTPGHAFRAAAGFALVAGLLVISPVGAFTVANKSSAVRHSIEESAARGFRAALAGLKSAKEEDSGNALQNFSAAGASFSEARSSLLAAAGSLKTIAEAIPVVGSKLRAADRLLEAADLLSAAAQGLANKGSIAVEQGGLLIKLQTIREISNQALGKVTEASSALEQIDIAGVPENYRESVTQLKENIGLAERALGRLPDQTEALSQAIGRDSQKRYLIIFQNSNELRATGGFIGSIAEATFDKGALKEVRVPEGGSYDLQGDLRAALLPPAPLRRVVGKWQFHDANWFADFPTTAEKLNWFYQKSGGPSVDGVIAVNSEILPILLKITGPIAMPDYKRTITEENVVRETQSIVELEHDPADKAPKKFIAELVGAVLERLDRLDAAKMLEAGEALGEALKTKTIQLAFFDESLKSEAENYHWSGGLGEMDSDSLLIVDSNIGGGKTDSVMKKTARVEIMPLSSGGSVNTVTLVYEHRGIPTDKFSGEIYRDYLRLYAPKNSRLVSASGDFKVPEEEKFEPEDPTFGADPNVAESIGQANLGPGRTDVFEESGRAVFGNWITLKPGERAVVRFVYETPSSVLLSSGRLIYKLHLLKQSGANRSYEIAISPSGGARPIWRSADLVANDDAKDPEHLEHDRFYAVIYENK
jgi:hypothetical protein